jgi:IS1 family transposase
VTKLTKHLSTHAYPDNFRRLLGKIPVEYLRCASYSDYWKSYRIRLSKGNHQQVGKESGKTNHIERWNTTLRARISRYVRKSLSFSHKLKYHHLVTKLLIVDYNQSCLLQARPHPHLLDNYQI